MSEIDLETGAHALVLQPYTKEDGTLYVRTYAVSPIDEHKDVNIEAALALLSAAFSRMNDDADFLLDLTQYAISIGALEHLKGAPTETEKPTITQEGDNVIRVDFGKKK